MATTTKREQILYAANRIVQRDGVTHLTIDAVAHEVGMSKGGVFYHFPSKEALIKGLLMQLLHDFDADVERALAQEADPSPGRWLRSYIRASTDESSFSSEENEAAFGLIAAIATDPGLLDLAYQSFAHYQQRSEHDGLLPIQATIIRLAIDGLMFTELFRLAAPTGTRRAEVIQALLDMTRSSQHANESTDGEQSQDR
ncbi:TetR family transcriptional regulator [Dictyobacter alpinus]|uniref:TetR family transcriptional regulator n=1 Tax=Dictyobacter alpinus TaxID=2014873 RepID=A0A402BEI1_9CHLR|nr:TetR family transcriptional regulator [Dictyobacter alpinus]GCE29841.1 TetR family transcriptional regulator [Dictyobacter alpinus]